jgi:hypothetical protein
LATVSKQIHRHTALQMESNALHMVGVAPDVNELARLFDEAEARGIESVMAAATFRAEAFATRERKKQNIPLDRSPEQRIAVDMRIRLEKFRKEHPSASERLRAIAGQRQHITAELERAKKHWLRAYGWTGPQPVA